MINTRKVINTRKDLDALQGTPKHAAFMAMLRGSIFRLEKDDAARTWKVVEDTSTIERFGFTRADFPDAVPPALPEYVRTPSPRYYEILSELAVIDAKSIRALREGDSVRINNYEAQAQALRTELAAVQA